MKEEDYQSLNFRNGDIDNIRSRSNTNTNPRRDTLTIPSSKTPFMGYKNLAAQAFPGIDTTKDTVLSKRTKQGRLVTPWKQNLSSDTTNTRVVKRLGNPSAINPLERRNSYSKLKKVAKSQIKSRGSVRKITKYK